MSSGFEQRKRALEEEFFHRVNTKLADDLKKSMADEESRKSLAAATGFKDEKTLQVLVDQGMTAESIAAMSLVPLVKVAWADFRVDEKEKQEIKEGTDGISDGSVAAQLLNSWLVDEPKPSLFEAWKAYMEALLDGKDDAFKASLKSEIIGRCEAIANASGGSFGFGKVSPNEKLMIAEIERVFD